MRVGDFDKEFRRRNKQSEGGEPLEARWHNTRSFETLLVGRCVCVCVLHVGLDEVAAQAGGRPSLPILAGELVGDNHDGWAGRQLVGGVVAGLAGGCRRARAVAPSQLAVLVQVVALELG